MNSIDAHAAVSSLLSACHGRMSPSEILDVVVENIGPLPGSGLSGGAALMLLDPQGRLTEVAERGFTPGRDAFGAHVVPRHCQEPESLGAGVRFIPADDPAGDEPSCFVLPLVDGGTAIGALPLLVEPGHRPAEAEFALMRDLAPVLSTVVSRLITEEMVEIRQMERDAARSDTLNKLGVAAEFRDQETGMHVARMKHYAEAIAEAMDLPRADLEKLKLAAPMHDVGKIGIADRILLKPGKLDDEEYAAMKKHTLLAANVLAGDDEIMAIAREIAVSHHEKWDGTGYPAGLRGEEIPLFGRICAVADVFDALTSERPYKKPWATEKAAGLINELSGRDFDPGVVEAFNRALPKILRIRELFRDETVDPHQELNLPPMERPDDGFVTWDDSLSVGIAVIDEHHRYLIDLTNELYKAITGQCGSAEIGRVLYALEQYADIHFQEEERMMRRYDYGRLTQHLAAHDAFRAKVARLWEEFRQSPLTLRHGVLYFLRDWLVNHIQKEDKLLQELVLAVALRRMMAIMVVADGRVEETELTMMAQIHHLLVGSAIGADHLRQEVAEAERDHRSIAGYLAGISGVLTEEFKRKLIKAGYMIANADGRFAAEERALLTDLAGALDLPEGDLDRLLAELGAAA